MLSSNNPIIMDIEEIQKMFTEMGLGSSEQRDKLVKDLSINMVDSSYDENYKIITGNNTLKAERYA